MSTQLRRRLVPSLAIAAASAFLSGSCPLAEEPQGPQVDVIVVDDSWSVPEGLTVRARVTAITPKEPTAIKWRHGGEGLGGAVTRGTLAEATAVGEWSPAVPVASFTKGRFPKKLFLTFMVGRKGKARRDLPRGSGRETLGGSTGVEMEFELRFQGEVVKRFREAGPDGGTIGVVIPAYHLTGGKAPRDKAFLEELGGILPYATRRAEMLESLPWAKEPLPKRYALVTDVGGYGVGIYYGIRHANKAVVQVECRSLRQLGVNGFRSAPRFLSEMAYERRGFAQSFGRG